MLMGSDYSEGTMEPREAIEAARAGVIVPGVSLMTGDNVHWNDIVSPKQQEKFNAGAPPTEPETIATFAAANKWPPRWCIILSKH
jgi:hypothetical protein